MKDNTDIFDLMFLAQLDAAIFFILPCKNLKPLLSNDKGQDKDISKIALYWWSPLTKKTIYINI